MKLVRVIPVLALLALGGCYYEEVHHHHDCDYYGDCGNGGYTPPADVVKSTIDTGAQMSAIDPGQGAGAFLEYQGQGRWHIYTSCDTELSGTACRWDIIATAMTGDAPTAIEAENLEGSDWVGWYDAQSAQLVAETTYDFDGFLFDASPGATVRVDVYLDGQPAPRYIYWIGNGGLHQGSPSNPIDLTPSAE
jgi:hypothetical protein